jgi:ketosteroid isomerase-like protein
MRRIDIFGRNAMNTIRRAACLLGALAVLTGGAAFAGPKEEVDAAEDARYQAMIDQDREALAATLADEFVYHQPNGMIATKPMYLGQVIGGPNRIYKAERYDVKIVLHGDVATAMGETRLDVDMGGKRFQPDLRYLNVWVKRDGRWQLAARQSVFKPAPK